MATTTGTLAEIDKREQAASIAEHRRAELAKPATPAAAEALDTVRTVAWFKHLLGRDDLGDLAGIDDEQFKTALRTVPATGWPDKKDDAAHLLALRTAEPKPVVEPEPEPEPNNTGLHRLLWKV